MKKGITSARRENRTTVLWVIAALVGLLLMTGNTWAAATPVEGAIESFFQFKQTNSGDMFGTKADIPKIAYLFTFQVAVILGLFFYRVSKQSI